MNESNRRRGKRKRRNGKNMRILWIAGIAVAVLLVMYLAFCTAGGGDKIYPGITVAGVDVGGMTCEEAGVAIGESDAIKYPSDTEGVLFQVETVSKDHVTVPVPMSSMAIDCESSASRAWNVGHTSGFFGRGSIYLSCLLGGRDSLPVYQNTEALETILDGMDAQVGNDAVQSSWWTTDTDLVMSKGIPGNRLERESLREEIADWMGQGKIVILAEAEPQFTVEMEQFYPDELDMHKVLEEVEVTVQDAVFDKEQKFFQTERVGISFDPDAAQTVFDNLNWGDTGSQALILTYPTVTLEQLTSQLYQDTLGTCTTTISGTENRVQNVAMATQYFNGTVLMPGEEFSYNGVVGKRTKERGFLDAPAYVSGETVQETGGGICQGSSTIYLAAMRSNLEIVERYNHGYITKYVPDGMDATVYYGAKDFRFRNNTPFPLKIVGTVSGRTLTVNIQGTKSDNITVEMTNEITGSTPYKTVYKVDESLPAGTTKVSVTPYTGYTVKVYRNLYENGNLISTKLESDNVYKSRDKVVLVSPADAAAYGIG